MLIIGNFWIKFTQSWGKILLSADIDRLRLLKKYQGKGILEVI